MLVAAGLLVACGEAPAEPIGSRALILAQDEAHPAAAAYLEAIVGEAPEVQVVDATSFDDVEALARKARAGLVVVLDAEALTPDRVPAERMSALGTDGFVLEAIDAGDWTSRLEGDGATFALLAGNTPISPSSTRSTS